MYKEVGKTEKKPFWQGFPWETNNLQGEVLESTTDFPSANSNNKDGRKIQGKPPKNQMVRLQKQIETTFCNVSVELVPLKILEQVQPLL